MVVCTAETWKDFKPVCKECDGNLIPVSNIVFDSPREYLCLKCNRAVGIDADKKKVYEK